MSWYRFVGGEDERAMRPHWRREDGWSLCGRVPAVTMRGGIETRGWPRKLDRCVVCDEILSEANMVERSSQRIRRLMGGA